MEIIEFILYLLLGVLPCITWLLFYLRQDVHPESNKKIIEIFLWGMVMVLPAILLEDCFSTLFPQDVTQNSFLSLSLYYIIGVGLVEEFLKYFIVKLRVISSPHFDEPIDAMLYLIIAGLGFATIENLMVVFNIKILQEAAAVSAIRLLTAIFLHTLAAAITGYFLASSLSHKKEKRKHIVAFGILLASTLHGLYNLSMIILEKVFSLFSFLLPIGIILLMGGIVYIFFSKVKKLPRSCKI